MRSDGASPFKIIIVDDDHDDALIVREVLNGIDELIHVEHVSDGQDLIDLLFRKKIPDLIFLDLNMPRKGGIETLREIRNDKQWHEIPVTVLSTASNHDQIGEAYSYGANCYITKQDRYSDWIKVMKGLVNFFGRENYS